MKYYDSFMATAKTPVELWKEHTQQFLNENFINSSNYLTVGRETGFGTLEFECVSARVMSVLDSKVGDKINDDFKTIFFDDLEYKPPLGARFSFDNNIWIVYSTDNYNSLNSACYIRRCNNTINSLDENGNVHQEPCVIDLKPTRSGFIEDLSMWTPNSRQIIMYQKNDWTKHLDVNSRIMFSNKVYRIGVSLDFNRTETFNKDSINFVTAYLDNDLLNEFDNLELQIEDYNPPSQSTGDKGTQEELFKLTPEDFYVPMGEEKDYKLLSYYDDEKTVEITPTSNKYVEAKYDATTEIISVKAKKQWDNGGVEIVVTRTATGEKRSFFIEIGGLF